MDRRTLVELYRHMEWADAVVWDMVVSSPAAQGDARVGELLYHVHLVQHAFLRTWRGEPRDTPFPTFDDLSALMQWGLDYHREAAAYLAGTAEATLDTPMPVAWAEMVEAAIGRPPEPTTFRDTVLQVPLHSLHHRAQLNTRLRELGLAPTIIDYIAWVWFGRPAAAWPAGVRG